MEANNDSNTGKLKGYEQEINPIGKIYGNYSFGSSREWMFSDEGIAHTIKITLNELQEMNLDPKELKQMSVMDVGTGRQATAFALLGAKTVEHFDISEENVEFYKKYLKIKNIKNITSTLADVTKYDLGQNQFDFVYLNGIVQHFENTEQGLKNIAKAIKKGGILWLYFYRSGSFKRFVVEMLRDLLDASYLEETLQAACSLYGCKPNEKIIGQIMDDFFVPFARLFNPNIMIETMQLLGFEAISSHKADPLGIYDHNRMNHSSIIVFKKIREGIDYSENLVTPVRKPVSQLRDINYNEEIIKKNIVLFYELKELIKNKKVDRKELINFCLALHRISSPTYYPNGKPVIGNFTFFMDSGSKLSDHGLLQETLLDFKKQIENNYKKEKVIKMWKIPLFKTYWQEKYLEKVEEVIRRGTYWAAGPEINAFEEKIAQFCGRKYALTFNSGTSALVALYSALGVSGKEIIVPSFTFIATANAVVLAGGKPVFAESEEETFGLDAADVEKKITPRTKAIVALNYAGGVSRDIEKLQEIASRHNLILLEDNAHSLGVRKNGRMCGTFGEGAILSFCQNKLITTGEGGAVITDSKDWYEKMKLFRSHGRVEEGKDYFSSNKEMEYLEAGHNLRMPTMNAALGLAQLEDFAQIKKLRMEKGQYLNAGLRNLKGVKIPNPYSHSDHFYQIYTIMLADQETRDRLMEYLTEKGIMSRVYYHPIHLKDFFLKNYGYKKGDLPNTEQISERVLTLPIHPDISFKELDEVIKVIKEFMETKEGNCLVP